ncbi:glycoside hydrolase family 38 C-terminal domain-containing protein [Olivibacter domesticus]|uniref:Glycosyl hydrolases family 38 C-terminal domain-containing protein n=1 Tax=Olivibacter domesticus TaxID=407022 RepID=A0A1H7WW87_OLID1|nr:glycoside hydrolase family 38 C-terminal domain-containing protein [Olivibacter domesticus]SEM25197.1 Glycosyl hydrolases family 38 C-terminal domain-containing protein [Olivibacter domesticus]
MKESFLLCWFFFASSVLFAQKQEDTSVKEIVIVFKTHFDIGYTDYAEAVVKEYSTSMMENAFRIMEKSKRLAPEKQFVWTVPGWPMSQMINQSLPDIKSNVEAAFVKGRFVIHALPFNIQTESSDPEMLVRGMGISSAISRRHGLPLPYDAKMSDVPSQSWMLPTLLKHAGVKFLQIGCNGAFQSPEVPELFWWEGPDGSKLMTMYSEKGYGTSLLPPPNWPYKSWLAIIQNGDNSGPPTPETVDKVLAEIHQQVPNAKIKIGRMSDFYDAVMKENPQLPVVRGDMPDTWIYGFMSMPREVKESRRVSKDLFALESLNTLYNIWSPKEYNISNLLSEAYTDNLLFDEHTFGMAMSHGRNGTWSYGDEFKIERAKGVYDHIEKSWKEKADRVFSADKMVAPALNQQLRALAQEINVKGKRIFVYNSLPWERSGLVTIKGRSSSNPGTAVKDVETGEIIPISNENNILQFIAKNVPASGYRNYILTNEAPSNAGSEFLIDESTNTIENKYLKIQFDPIRGSISSILEKQSGREMVDKKSEYGFGQYLYERFSKKDADSYVKSIIKRGGGGQLTRPNLTDEPHVTEKGHHAKIVFSKNAVSIAATMLFSTSTKLPHNYSITVTLYKNTPNVELNWNINSKPAESWPEAGWISLPFNVSDPTFKLARLGGVIDPARDFVKGSNFDYSFLNSGMSIIDKYGKGIGLSTPDAPGISLDRPGLWKYSGYFIPRKPNVFVNLYNNLWGTNFAEWIEGSWSAKINLWFIDHFNNEKSIITPSEESRSPLLATLINDPGGYLPVSAAGVQLSQKGVMITAFGKNPDGDGTVLRVWEQAGGSGKMIVTLPDGINAVTAMPVDLRGEKIGEPIKIIAGKFGFEVNAYAPASFILQ